MGDVLGGFEHHVLLVMLRLGSSAYSVPIVRELFRNLVTHEGTRAVREWNELLSVFGSHDVGAGLIPTGLGSSDTSSRQGRREGPVRRSSTRRTPHPLG